MNQDEQIQKEFDTLNQGLNPSPPADPSFKFPVSPVENVSLSANLRKDLMDTIWNKLFYFLTIFESSAGYDTTVTGTGASAVDPDGLILQTGATSGSTADFSKTPNPTFGSAIPTNTILSWNRFQRFRANFALSAITAQTAYITRGVNFGTGYPYFGFKISDGTLLGVSRDNATDGEATITIASLAVDTVYVVEAELFPDKKIVFRLVNNTTKVSEEKGVITTKLPKSGNTNIGGFFEYYIVNSAAANKQLTSSFFEYQQER